VAYPTSTGSQDFICYRATEQQDWRIYLPQQLLQPVTNWYHHVQGHPGIDRMYRTVSKHFYSPKYKDYVTQFLSNCHDCQKHKLHGPGTGELPPTNLTANPWDEVAVDLAGPWTFTTNNNRHKRTFHVLTCVDPLTTFAEIIPIESTKSAHIAWKFEQEWLS